MIDFANKTMAIHRHDNTAKVHTLQLTHNEREGTQMGKTRTLTVMTNDSFDEDERRENILN